MNTYEIDLSPKDLSKAFKQARQRIAESGIGSVLHGSDGILKMVDEDRELIINSVPSHIAIEPQIMTKLSSSYRVIPDDILRKHIRECATSMFNDPIKASIRKHATIKKEEVEYQLAKANHEFIMTVHRLDSFSLALKDKLEKDYYLKARSWKGADIEILSERGTSDKENNPSWVIVKTRYYLQLSWVFLKIRDIANNFINYMNKYWFYGSMGEAANEFMATHEVYDDYDICIHVIEKAKSNIVESNQNARSSLEYLLTQYSELIQLK